jgi:iron(III) transport system ATP-binding protein
MLKLTAVSHSYQSKKIIDDISLQVDDCELLCLLGASGSGKSTIMRLIAGLEPLQMGRIEYADKILADTNLKINVPTHFRNIGMVFQHPALFPHLTVAQNICFGLKGLSRSKQQEITQKMLQLIELQGFEKRYPHQLSGGQHQRVALARSLAPSPIIMLLDEPFANLDHALRRNLRMEVVELLRIAKIPVILVTHDPEEALSMADKIAIIGDNGCILQYSGVEDIYFKPKSLKVADFFSHINIFNAQINGDLIHSQIGKINRNIFYNQAELLSGGAILCTRPDGLRLAEPHEDGVFAAIEQLSHNGAGWLIKARLSEGNSFMMQLSNIIRPHIGENIKVRLNENNVFCFNKN